MAGWPAVADNGEIEGGGVGGAIYQLNCHACV